MQCPYCESANTKVLDSRPLKERPGVRRRRTCESCSSRFSTVERLEERPLWVTKRGGQREPFSRRKLNYSLQLACRKRQIPEEKILRAAEQIESRLRQRGDRTIDSKAIGEETLVALQGLDPIAFVRFASVYRSFEDLEAFRNLVDDIAAGVG